MNKSCPHLNMLVLVCVCMIHRNSSSALFSNSWIHEVNRADFLDSLRGLRLKPILESNGHTSRKRSLKKTLQALEKCVPNQICGWCNILHLWSRLHDIWIFSIPSSGQTSECPVASIPRSLRSLRVSQAFLKLAEQLLKRFPAKQGNASIDTLDEWRHSQASCSHACLTSQNNFSADSCLSNIDSTGRIWETYRLCHRVFGEVVPQWVRTSVQIHHNLQTSWQTCTIFNMFSVLPL